jgi:translation initiation factor 2 alpha subunit (eIF-2alpha)
MPAPRMTEKAQREMEAKWKNDAEAHRLLDLIMAEFESDPMSQQCFDNRIVSEVKLCVLRQRAYAAKGIG